MEPLHLIDLRGDLIRQEETIIFAMIERGQFQLNTPIYQSGRIKIPEFDGCFSDYLLLETERIHARVRRYTSPDEHPFFSELPDPILPAIDMPAKIIATDININCRVRAAYHADILPAICEPGDDGHYGSSATCDVACLQSISKRIHFGKYVAECKYQADTAGYDALCARKDREGILEKLTNREVETAVLKRIGHKAATYGRDVDDQSPACGLDPTIVQSIYSDYIIPLTKDVEIEYLLVRANNNA